MTTAPAPLIDVLERDRTLHLLQAWRVHMEAPTTANEDDNGLADTLLDDTDDHSIHLYACGYLADPVASVTYRPHKKRVHVNGHYWEWLNDPHEAARVTPARVRESFPIYLPLAMVRGILKRGWAKHGKVPLHVTAAAAIAHRLTQTERDIKNHRESIRRLTDEQEAYAHAHTR